MFVRSSASALAFLMLFSATAPAMAASCFTPEEAKAAQLRTMQQEFNVAALNCRTTDPSDPTFSDRYNEFIGKFGGALQDNAQSLRRHFTRTGGNFDGWMTKVANDAGQRVFSDPEYCQRAWENLGKANALQPHEVETFATTATAAHSNVTLCGEHKAKATKTKSAKAKHKAKKTHAES